MVQFRVREIEYVDLYNFKKIFGFMFIYVYDGG